MGRSLLIYVTLVLGVYGLIVVNTQENRTQIAEGNVSSYEDTHANNTAQAALELTMQKLKEVDYDFSKVANPVSFTIGNSSANVEIYHTKNSNLKFNQILLVSTGKYNGKTSEVKGLFRSAFPTPYSAMGFYGNNDVNFSTGGNAFEMSGHDAASDKPSMPAITAQGSNSYNDIMNDIPSKDEDNIVGEGGTPSVQQESQMNPKDLEELIPIWESNYDNKIGDYGTNGDEPHNLKGKTFGTSSSPEITIVRDDASFQGGTTGAGVLLIQDNATLDMGKNFEFEGLIINNSQNTIFDAKGTPNFRGALMSVPPCGTSQSDCSASIDFQGNISLQYDSDALFNMQQGLMPSKLNFNYTRRSMYE